MSSLFDFLETKRCFGCDCFGDYFCAVCKLEFSGKVFQVKTGAKFATVSRRNPAMMRAIAGWKDRHLKKLTYTFADFLFEIEPDLVAKEFEIITPPQRKEAFASRGFNPVGDLAIELSRRNPHLIFNPNSVKCLRQPHDQRGLDITARKANVSGAFQVLAISDYPVLLLDDVWTSGSTLLEVAKQVGQSKVSRILVLTTAYKLGRKDVWKIFGD